MADLSDINVAKLQRMLAGPEKPSGPAKRTPEGAANQFGKYTLLRTLGPGVMEATDNTRPHTLVLRVLGRTNDPSTVAAVCAHLKPLAALQHPVIVTYHKLSTVGGGYFTVRDYVHGDPLEKTTLEPLPAMQTFYEVARAIEFSHERDIVHGGIAPPNVILSSNGHPHIVDFAVGQLRRHFDPATAPPVADKGTDIDALHLLFLSLLSGKAFALIAAGEIPPLRRVHPVADADFQNFARTSYPTAGKMADEVARILQSLPSDYSSKMGLLDRYRLHERSA